MIGVASISLIVGGVGIMNIMVVSVNERIREIGIRMAIGAKRQDILLQFLTESVILSAGGGIIGVLLGVIGYIVIVFAIDWPFAATFAPIFISFLFSIMVGIFFGYYPARRASLLNPIDSLRHE
jgi:putative ABC transport system permease protein